MLKSKEVLDHYFLDARCMLLELGATLDRHDRADSAKTPHGEKASKGDDPRLTKLREAIDLLADRDAEPDRAERLLELFSDL